jgi:Domain of unknown function (DUF4331)
VIRKRAVAAMSLVATLALIGLTPTIAGASSHREAPLISQDPAADNTDLYAFRDPVDQTKLDILANYIGLEQPAAGPNFNNFADDVEYRININNTGGATDDIVYRFRFHTTFNRPLASKVPLFNAGPITTPNDSTQSEFTTYSVARSDASGTRVIATGIPVAPPNIGPRSFGSGAADQATEMAAYQQVATKAIKPLPGGGTVFAGPVKDAFFADLGSIFDLVALRPLQSLHAISTPGNAPGVDGLAGKNVHTIAVQLPINDTANGVLAPGMSGVDPAHGSIVGVYASSARREVRFLAGDGTERGEGGWVQVSRLGLPLVNEVLIPIDKKDKWNASDPASDGANGFLGDILDSTLVKLLPTLYPGTFTSHNTPRGGAANRPDLVKLATGQFIGAPASGPGAQAAADLLRVNTAVPAVQGTVANRLGALQGDSGGFPNGRRLTDDVVDIELRVLAGVLLGPPYSTGPASVLTDGVDQSADAGFVPGFPYVGPPIAGYYQPLPGPTPK